MYDKTKKDLKVSAITIGMLAFLCLFFVNEIFGLVGAIGGGITSYLKGNELKNIDKRIKEIEFQLAGEK